MLNERMIHHLKAEKLPTNPPLDSTLLLVVTGHQAPGDSGYPFGYEILKN